MSWLRDFAFLLVACILLNATIFVNAAAVGPEKAGKEASYAELICWIQILTGLDAAGKADDAKGKQSLTDCVVDPESPLAPFCLPKNSTVWIVDNTYSGTLGYPRRRYIWAFLSNLKQ